MGEVTLGILLAVVVVVTYAVVLGLLTAVHNLLPSRWTTHDADEFVRVSIVTWPVGLPILAAMGVIYGAFVVGSGAGTGLATWARVRWTRPKLPIAKTVRK